ncbi:MAG: TolC family protein [Syntrophobacteraceae bacterium]
MKALRAGVVLALFFAISAGCASVPEEEARLISDRSMWENEILPSEAPSEKLPELTEKSTLSDYLAYAALNNPGLKAAFLRWKAALEKIPQVTALPDPHFTYAYFIESVETRVGPQHQSFALNQTFPWLGKLQLRGNAAAEAARAEKARYDAVKLKLFYQVQEAYYEYYYLARAITVTHENLGYVKYLESVARAGYSAGIAPYADVVRTQVELGKLEDSLKTLNDQAEPIAAKVNAALNRPPDAQVFWPEKLEKEKVSFTSEQLLTWLKESNPDLKAIDFQAAGEKWNIDLAKKDYFPDITVGLQGIDTGPAVIKPTPSDSGKDPIIATVSINLPIWWEKYRAEEREAAALYKSFQRERVNSENSLIANVKWVSYKYRDAERKIDLYESALLPEAKQAFDVSIQGYQTGQGSFVNVVDAIRVLLEFELSYDRAFADRAQRLAELEMLVGRAILRKE